MVCFFVQNPLAIPRPHSPEAETLALTCVSVTGEVVSGRPRVRSHLFFFFAESRLPPVMRRTLKPRVTNHAANAIVKTGPTTSHPSSRKMNVAVSA